MLNTNKFQRPRRNNLRRDKHLLIRAQEIIKHVERDLINNIDDQTRLVYALYYGLNSNIIDLKTFDVVRNESDDIIKQFCFDRVMELMTNALELQDDKLSNIDTRKIINQILINDYGCNIWKDMPTELSASNVKSTAGEARLFRIEDFETRQKTFQSRDVDILSLGALFIFIDMVNDNPTNFDRLEYMINLFNIFIDFKFSFVGRNDGRRNNRCLNNRFKVPSSKLAMISANDSLNTLRILSVNSHQSSQDQDNIKLFNECILIR